MKVRVGIDVGGTFTDAVCIDNDTYELIGYLKIPTTHTEKEGVSKGVVVACQKLLEQCDIAPEDVVFIAHGTTQATNALLEGDVEKVGIIGVGESNKAYKVKMDTQIGDIELATGKFLYTNVGFINVADENYQHNIKEQLKSFREENIRAVVVSGAFSVDDPQNEQKVMEDGTKDGFLMTGTHEVSKLYGLRVRTRTAAINASILPKMIETANMTEYSVKKSGIQSPLMIMRCDGGVMDVQEVKKRPVLTMLSGPAAGVAGALMYEKISDGIFLEVGGTSTDMSAVKNGKVMLRYAEVGGHKTYVNSLDVRTVGIAGGSLIRANKNGIVEVGPRSSHIARLSYACFTDDKQISDPVIKTFRPKEGDADDYVMIECADGSQYAITLSCAANYLGYVEPTNYSYGNRISAEKAIKALAEYCGTTPENIARQIMDKAMEKVEPVVRALIKEYNMEEYFTTLVGGGGGAASVVPYLAEKMKLKWRIARNAEVISPIGVALAMVRDSVERIIPNPNEKDLAKIREEAFSAAVNAGANPDSIEITIEIESEKNLVRAIACGTTELRTKDVRSEPCSDEQVLKIVSESLNGACGEMEITIRNGKYRLVKSSTTTKSFLGLLKKTEEILTLIDDEGVVRLQKRKAKAYRLRLDTSIAPQIIAAIDKGTVFNDGGEVLPDIFLLANNQIKALAGLPRKEQIISLAELELEYLEPDALVHVLVCKK